MSIFWIGAAAIVIPMLVATADQWRRKRIGPVWHWWQSEHMPQELRYSTLFLSEHDIETSIPVPMHGCVDQVYQALDGTLIPLDTKLRKRHRVYKADIIQLSVYRVILSYQYDHPVTPYGYVRTVVETDWNEQVRYIRTKLLSERKVVRLWQRYNAIAHEPKSAVCTCHGRFHGQVKNNR